MSPVCLQSKAKFIAFALLVASPNFMLCAVETTAALSSTPGSTPSSELGFDTSPVSELALTFSGSYTKYKQAVADNNDAEILKFSSQAYLLGKQKFGDKSIDTVNLGLNYAAALSQKDKTLDDNQAKQRKTRFCVVLHTVYAALQTVLRCFARCAFSHPFTSCSYCYPSSSRVF